VVKQAEFIIGGNIFVQIVSIDFRINKNY
jgi:hypothetical protein